MSALAMIRRAEMSAYCQFGFIPPELHADAMLTVENKPSRWHPIKRWRWHRAVYRVLAYVRSL